MMLSEIPGSVPTGYTQMFKIFLLFIFSIAHTKLENHESNEQQTGTRSHSHIKHDRHQAICVGTMNVINNYILKLGGKNEVLSRVSHEMIRCNWHEKK